MLQLRFCRPTAAIHSCTITPPTLLPHLARELVQRQPPSALTLALATPHLRVPQQLRPRRSARPSARPLLAAAALVCTDPPPPRQTQRLHLPQHLPVRRPVTGHRPECGSHRSRPSHRPPLRPLAFSSHLAHPTPRWPCTAWLLPQRTPSHYGAPSPSLSLDCAPRPLPPTTKITSSTASCLDTSVSTVLCAAACAAACCPSLPSDAPSSETALRDSG
jgi:hypothetical protein